MHCRLNGLDGLKERNAASGELGAGSADFIVRWTHRQDWMVPRGVLLRWLKDGFSYHNAEMLQMLPSVGNYY